MPPSDKFKKYLKFKLMNFAKNFVRSAEWRIFRIGVGKDSRGFPVRIYFPLLPPVSIKWLSHGFIASIKTNSREYDQSSADLYAEK